MRPRRQQRARRRGDVGLAHQAFADQEGVHAALASRCRSAWLAMPLSAMTMRFFGTRGASLSVVSSVVSKVFEVAIVDADQPAVELQGAVELVLVVHLGDGVHAPGLGVGAERAGHHVVDGGHDDQDAVGAQRARLGHLIAVEHEVLAQGRQLRPRRALRVRCSGAPWKEGPSVSTERQAAPPAA